MTGEQLLAWSVRLVVLVPFAAAVLGLLLAHRRGPARAVAVGSAMAVLACAAYQLVAVHRGPAPAVVTTLPPLPVPGLEVPLRLVADDLSAVTALAVAVVGLAVQAYTRAYLARDARYGVFAATVSLFLAGMLLVVQSGDLLLTLVGWEVMGWCSFVLIAHESARAEAARAATKAFLVTRTADLGFVLAVVALAGAARSTDLGVLVRWWATAADGPVLTLALLGIVAGIAGKSGLVPFHDWLPDAMEGPTPASALIHAATMVAAGTYVVARLVPLFAAAPVARAVLAVLAALTMVYAAALALLQSDLKRLLAYSTLSQVALMLAALAVVPLPGGSLGGAGTRSVAAGAGVLHFLSHAMFKALLFLALGWLAVLAGGTAVAALRGSVRRHPAVSFPLAVGFLALAGVPPFVGFVSKEYVLTAAQEGAVNGWTGQVVLAAVLTTVLLTAAYCTRAWLVLTYLTDAEEVELAIAQEQLHPLGEGPEDLATQEVTLDELLTQPLRRVDLDEALPDPTLTQPLPAGYTHPGTHSSAHPGPHAADDDLHGSLDLDAPLPLRGLALLSLLGGALVLTPLVPGVRPHLDLLTIGVSLALVAVGAAAARLVTPRSLAGDLAARLPAATRSRADRGLHADRIYVALTRPVVRLARVVVLADSRVVDAYVRGAVVATRWAGAGGERAHGRRPSAYLVWVLAGVLAVGIAGVGLW